VLVGWFLGSWYTGQGRVGTDLDRFRQKASAALDESARMVEEYEGLRKSVLLPS